jgi:glycosyltransferase involved in cell wall biosynthesis
MQHELREPIVSIIIPYYNHGEFIDATIESIEKIPDKKRFEVVIVNDGSPDPYTNERLAAIASTGKYKIIEQKNQGVCVARNTAIQNSRGKFILPMDSDNMIRPEYIDEALRVFEKHPETMIVYCDYHLFGAETGIRKAGPFNLQRLMLDNFIDNCSMFRREMFDEIGGYDPFPTIVGVEDWELWMRAAFKGYKFHYIEKPLFDYRVAKNSQIKRLIANKIKGNKNTDYFIKKHDAYFGPQYIDENILNKFRSGFFGYLFKIILKLYFPKKFASMVEQGKLRKYL